jgi:hypothetical protein
MAAASPAERSEISSLAAHTRWSQVPDRTAATAPGRAALRARFDQQIDPSVTDLDQRRSMVDHALSAWMIRERRTRRNQARVLTQAAEILDATSLDDHGSDGPDPDTA